MLARMFRRRTAAVAALVVTGSALAVSVPSLVLHGTPSRAAAATLPGTAPITLTIIGSGSSTYSFSQLDGITSNATARTCPTCRNTQIPPTITLSAPFNASHAGLYKSMLKWQHAAVTQAGYLAPTADLTLTSLTGTTDHYILDEAWPIDVDVPVVPAGSTQVDFTVTFHVNELQFVT